MDIVYLPDMQKSSLETLSPDNSREVSEEKSNTLLFSQFIQQGPLSAKASSSDSSQGLPLSGTGNFHFSETNSASSSIKTTANNTKPDRKRNRRHETKGEKNHSLKHRAEAPYNKNEQENIVYLQNHSAKKAKKQSPPYKKTPSQIIPFPFPKAPPFMGGWGKWLLLCQTAKYLYGCYGSFICCSRRKSCGHRHRHYKQNSSGTHKRIG